MATNFFRDHRGIFEFIGKQGEYYILINQEDTKKLLDISNDNKDEEVKPIVYRLGIPIKRINGNVVRKMGLIPLPTDLKVVVQSTVMAKLTE